VERTTSYLPTGIPRGSWTGVTVIDRTIDLQADPGRSGARSVGILGAGRAGTALAAAMRAAGREVDGPARRGSVPKGDLILLCVPDAEIPVASAAVAGTAPLVGHVSGATPLSALEPASRAGAAVFGMHPLQTLTGAAPEALHGAGCAIGGSTPEAARAASDLARDVGMRPFALADHQRAAYHAAASVASNFLVTLEHAAERIAAGAGLEAEQARALLAPLVRTTVESWAALGPQDALTGPVARGDEATVRAQREAVGREAPELLALFDALLEATRRLAASRPDAVLVEAAA